MIKVGDTYETLLTFTAEQEKVFTELTGDVNPIHWDAEAAARAGYPAPIVHGMLAASMIGKVIGVDFPGKGTINIERSFQFLRPLYVNVPYMLTLKIADVNIESANATIKFKIKDTNNKICLSGSTRVKNTEKFGS